VAGARDAIAAQEEQCEQVQHEHAGPDGEAQEKELFVAHRARCGLGRKGDQIERKAGEEAADTGRCLGGERDCRREHPLLSLAGPELVFVDGVGDHRGEHEGGPISLLFAATYPARVEAIVLYETFVRYGGVPGYTPVWATDAHQQFTEMMLAEYGKGTSLAGFGGSRASDPNVQALWGRAERLSNSPGGFRALYEALLEADVRAVLASVRAPCLVMFAANGSMFDHQGRYLAEHLPRARMVVLDGIDHFPWFAGSERIVAEVEEFLTGARSAVADDRVLATLLFIDIVGSTERAAQLGDRRWREMLQAYYGLVRRQVERYRGLEVGTEGDGVFARFDGPARAVSCACAIRDGVQGLGLEIRAGLHTGEIETRGDDLTGLAIHIDRGKHHLKGIPDPWQLYAVARQTR
jgi:hypothetical protein